jgi:hypothetical protein
MDLSGVVPTPSQESHNDKPNSSGSPLFQIIDDAEFVQGLQKVIVPVSRSFFGRFYTVEGGRIRPVSFWNDMEQMVQVSPDFLRLLGELRKGASSESGLARRLKGHNQQEVRDICKALEKLGILERLFELDSYCKWGIKPENMPLVEQTLLPKETVSRNKRADEAAKAEMKTTVTRVTQIDILAEEKLLIAKMDAEFDSYLRDLVRNRFDDCVRFGETFSTSELAEYLQSLFGPNLFFDSFLTITQQYSLCDAIVRSAKTSSGIRSGFNLALFGEPGTGKSYSTRDMILGKEGSLDAHGLPVRNRYAGGITPARFIRLGQVYENRKFNFIVPEFNDWFRYEGMVEPLKIAMERGEIKYEQHRETIGPYRFSSFFSVNYNTSVFGKRYEVTIRDANFAAIEDRMVCRLHRLTKERFEEIAESQRRMVMGEARFGKMPRLIRDHLTLVYAAETQHPLVKNLVKSKYVMLTEEVYESIARARNAILSNLSGSSVPFSARLEERAIRLASALSLIGFFNPNGKAASSDYIPISSDALEFAIQFYVEEASVRSGERFDPADVLSEIRNNLLSDAAT